jgi:hypothetical protein
MCRRRAIAGLLLAAALTTPSVAAAAWTPPAAATRAGQAFGPAVAVGVRKQLTVAWVRTLHGRQRVELRRGTVDGGLRGPALVLDRSTHFVQAPVLIPVGGDGAVAVAWLRYTPQTGSNRGNHRLRGVIIAADGSMGPVRNLSGGGESAYDPSFAAGGDGRVVLAWSRRTFSQVADVTADGFDAVVRLGGAPIFGPFVAIDGMGAEVAARFLTTPGSQIFEADRPPGATAFGPDRVAAAAVSGRDIRVVGLRSGAVIATWTQTGGAIMAALRPPGGAFGPPVQVIEESERPRDVTVSDDAAGEILVAYRRGAPGEGHGVLRFVRLTADGASVGARRDITLDGGTSAPVLAADGTSGAFFGWSVRGLLRVRRFAPGGIGGTTVTLGRSDDRLAPALAGKRTMGAVVAWISGGRIMVSATR